MQVHDAPTQQALYEKIKEKVSFCHVVIIMAGVYSTYSDWIQREIEIAKVVYDKPVVAVTPWGAERTSTVVAKAADVTAKWNSASIVKAIREVC